MIKAYNGNEPYAFISYSHQDRYAAMEIIGQMERDSFRVWFDEGIKGGSAWDDNVASHIENCTILIALISSNYIRSDNCRDELNFARDLSKDSLLVFLEDVTLPSGMAMRMNRLHSIFRYAYERAEDFYAKLYSAKSMDIIRAQAEEQPTVHTVTIAAPAAPEKPRRVRIVGFGELTKLGYTPLSIAQRLVRNDYELYPQQTVENEGTPEQWSQYIESYPETFSFAINEKNEIIGNLSFVAVSEDVHFQKLLEGELMEETFKVDETEFILFEGEYIGYLLNMSMNIGYQTRENINLLFQSFIDILLRLAREDIFFRAWYVNVFRKDHEAMYKRMGFHYLVHNKSFGKLYEIKCDPFPESSLFYKREELRKLYEAHFS